MRALLFLVFLVGFTAFARAQTLPVAGTYLITGGRFEVCCGLIGPIVYPLPNSSQTHVRLTIDPGQQTASLAFLDEMGQTVHQVPACPPESPVPLFFTNGVLLADRILFRTDPGPVPRPASWEYTVTNSEDGLQLHGTLLVDPGFCADFPSQFRHTNVVATLLPTLSIRTSEVEVCWDSRSNRTHQVQFRSALGTNGWTNLGGPLPGSGEIMCLTDTVVAGEPRRFYRVVTLP